MKRHLVLVSMLISLEVTMRDIAYTPASIDVKQGEKIKFHFTNSGKLVHDAFIGDAKAQDKHEAGMRIAVNVS